MNDLNDVTKWATGLIKSLSAGERAALMREITVKIRQSQSKRIAQQQNASGSPFEKRKPQQIQGQKVKGAMFKKLRTARFLKQKSSPSAASLFFADNASRIARVHQYGLRDRVNQRGYTVQYPARELLGISDADKDLIEDIIIKHLSK